MLPQGYDWNVQVTEPENLYFHSEAFTNPRMFPDLKQDRKNPVLNAGTESGPGRGCSRMLGMGNFPDFWGKNLVLGKWHSGMQTSIIIDVFNLNLISMSSGSIRSNKRSRVKEKYFWSGINVTSFLVFHA